MKERTPTVELIRQLEGMANVGLYITEDMVLTITEAADRLEELDERIAIMTETEDLHSEER